MKVYILFLSIQYDGDDVYGVYSTKEKAIEEARQLPIQSDREHIYVSECELDTEAGWITEGVYYRYFNGKETGI